MPCNSVYVVKRGKVDVFKSGNLVRSITKHDYFGERGVLNNDTSMATYVANGSLTLWSISNIEFFGILNDKMRLQLNLRISYENEDVELQNLQIIKKLGKGMFARVYLVKTENGAYYALKSVSRRKVNKFAINEQLIVSSI